MGDVVASALSILKLPFISPPTVVDLDQKTVHTGRFPYNLYK